MFHIFKTGNGPDINKYFVIVYTTEFYSVTITDRKQLSNVKTYMKILPYVAVGAYSEK